MNNKTMNDIICWWSGGVTSAVACRLSINLFGLDRCRFIMIDTFNEDDDTYRFKEDCEKWYNKEIEVISNPKYNSIEEVWFKHLSLNVAHGAICSSELKRNVRVNWAKDNDFLHQVFGFDIDEPKRAKAIKLNYPEINPIFPLLFYGLSKKDCINLIEGENILVPNMYQLGFKNNNCFKTGCIQGGIGYWKKMKKEFPEKYHKMAEIEHQLTKRKGKPVTILKDQSKKAKDSGNVLVFLKKNEDYPNLKCLDDMKDMPVESLMECNGFCGVHDLEEKTNSQMELNLDKSDLTLAL